jgi:hypothetical protein
MTTGMFVTKHKLIIESVPRRPDTTNSDRFMFFRAHLHEFGCMYHVTGFLRDRNALASELQSFLFSS